MGKWVYLANRDNKGAIIFGEIGLKFGRREKCKNGKNAKIEKTALTDPQEYAETAKNRLSRAKRARGDFWL